MNGWFESMLFIASGRGHTDLVKMFIERGACVDEPHHGNAREERLDATASRPVLWLPRGGAGVDRARRESRRDAHDHGPCLATTIGCMSF